MGINNFVDWNYLGTFAGLTSTVQLIVQFSKVYLDKLPFHVPTQVYSYFVSVVVMFLTEIFEAGGNSLTLSEACLAFLNGFFVSIAANTCHETMNKFLQK